MASVSSATIPPQADRATPVTAIDPEPPQQPDDQELKKSLTRPRSFPMLRRLTMSFYNNDTSNYEAAPSDPPPSYDSVDKKPAPVSAGAPAPPRTGQPRQPLPLELAALTELRGKRIILASGSPRRRQLLAQVRHRPPYPSPARGKALAQPATNSSPHTPPQPTRTSHLTRTSHRSASPTSKSSRPASPKTCPRASPPLNMCCRRQARRP